MTKTSTRAATVQPSPLQVAQKSEISIHDPQIKQKHITLTSHNYSCSGTFASQTEMAYSL